MLFAHVRFRNTLVFPLSQMTRHYSSVNILVETFQLSWKKLIIPFFMLFVSCMLFAVFFHMAEKGHVCEVDGSGTACVSNDDEGKPARDLVSSIVGIDLADDAIASIGGESEAKHAVVQVMAESGSLTAIPSSFEGLWMALVTVTTVGYGRWGYPVTPVGKIIELRDDLRLVLHVDAAVHRGRLVLPVLQKSRAARTGAGAGAALSGGGGPQEEGRGGEEQVQGEALGRAGRRRDGVQGAGGQLRQDLARAEGELPLDAGGEQDSAERREGLRGDTPRRDGHPGRDGGALPPSDAAALHRREDEGHPQADGA